jgi:hypothetical protein
MSCPISMPEILKRLAKALRRAMPWGASSARSAISPGIDGPHAFLAIDPKPSAVGEAPASQAPPFPPTTDAGPIRNDHRTDALLLFLVDLLDEMDALPFSTSGGVAEMALIRSRLEDRILLDEGEIIRDHHWDPNRQRAVQVEEGATDGDWAPGVVPRRSGLLLGGRVVRKQEVALERRNSPT